MTCSSMVCPSPRDPLPLFTPFCAMFSPLPPPPTSIWSMVSWYSFSRLLNSDSVSLITFSRLSSCCWGEQEARLEAGRHPA